MKNILFLLTCGIAVLCTGCGGSNAGLRNTGSQSGKIKITFTWPSNSRIIPISANSIVVTANANDAKLQSVTIPRPTNGQTSATASFDQLPATTIKIIAEAFPTADGSGQAQAYGTTSVDVMSGGTSQASLTMGSTVAKVIVTPSSPPSLIPGTNAQLTATPQDASGNTILVASSTVQWTTSDASVLSIDASGITPTVHALKTGSVTIKATFTEVEGSLGQVPVSSIPLTLYVTSVNLEGMNCVGSSALLGHKLRLVDTSTFSAGAAWSPTSLDVYNGFDASFAFQITNPGGGGATPGADGLAFVIQGESANALGGSAQEIGYGGISDSLAVEFDTYENDDYGDPDKNHISVHTNGAGQNSGDEALSIGRTSDIPDLQDGKVHNVTLSYTVGHLKVFIDDASKPVLDLNVVLSNILPLANGKAWVGFTAGTGSSYQNADVLSFEFQSH